MATFKRATYPISQFLRWSSKKELVLQPKFQRRAVWEKAARSYLIDTIVRDLPMPKVYIRRVVNPDTRLAAYEVVDGQQRLRAILDFYAGSLVLSRRQNPELGDITFDRLPDPARRTFLQYEISTEVMEKATDPEVWAMFERLNTYTLTLNRQERLNAKWFGYFKQTAYRLAAEESSLRVWKTLRIFADRQIARMKEVELTSDILVAIVDGISDITAIASAYETYDDEFSRREEAKRIFRGALEWISEELGDAVRNTRFKSKAWFYSLAVETIDAQSGIPDGLGRRTLSRPNEIQERMLFIEKTLKTAEPGDLPSSISALQAAMARGTSHVPQRRTRHHFFLAMLTFTNQRWETLWDSSEDQWARLF